VGPTPTPQISIAPGVTVQVLDGEAVILDVDTGRYFGLDDASTRMWDVVTAQGSIERACVKLLEEFDVEPPRLEHDLREFVEQLAEHGLVKLSDA